MPNERRQGRQRLLLAPFQTVTGVGDLTDELRSDQLVPVEPVGIDHPVRIVRAVDLQLRNRHARSVGERIHHHAQLPLAINGGLLASPALDNRASVAAVTVCLEALADRSHVWDVLAVATTQEEVGLYGAQTAAYALAPQLAIAIDVTFGTGPAARDFADRTYEDDGQLTPRKIEGSVIDDPDIAGKRALQMARDQEIVTRSGKRIKARIETICVHGDKPSAVAQARRVRQMIEAAGLTIKPFAPAA